MLKKPKPAILPTAPTETLPPEKPLKIAILGTASTSVNDAPFKDKDWLIWSLCYNYNKVPRVDKLFEIHAVKVLQKAGFSDEAVKELRKAKVDLIVQKKGEMFPDATEYPLELVLNCFPRKYFTSSIAWMMALAIISVESHSKKHNIPMGEIGLWGVDMIDTDEYAYQKGACEYLIGVAEGKGIKVTVAVDSPICRAERLYAFEDTGISRDLIVRRQSHNQEAAQREAEYLNARDTYNFTRGKLTECNDISNRWR